ncbi:MULTISPECIES: hypothetical protein [Niastella]|uniref:Uncharacterized protein n=1 Tax=Niastella soli TaxID=2821487 RepID=A0ABS3Z382_9BACT|nr:hypothetical protein [Niastella soli]MBO9204616.1 hypothetical protein [Niastella soli]
MKRAKIMLLAIAVIATVGGALAFKAQRFAFQNVYCATQPAGGALTCTTIGVPFSTTNVSPSFTTPCKTWHAALGITTTSYYTTTGQSGIACKLGPVAAQVTDAPTP